MAQRTTLGIRTVVTLIAFMLSLSVSIQAQQVLPLPAAPGEANQTEFRGSGVVEQTVPRAFGPRDTQLLQNGGFEAAGATSKLAANWTGIRLLKKSRRVCNRIDHPTKPNKIVAHEGSCAFQFLAQITNVTRLLKQVATPMGITNDVLDLSYWAEGKDVDGNPRVQVVVKYNDNTKKKLVVAAQTGTFAYTQFTGSMVLDKPVTKIIVKLIADDGGRLYFDDVSLMHSPFEFAPTANDDSFAVSVGTVNASNSVTTNDNLANPPATVTNYANPGDIGGGSTVASPGLYTIPGSGGITVSIAANGTMMVDSQTSGMALTGVYTFDYQLSNIVGSDTAMVTLSVQVGPIAQDDSFVVLIGDPLSSNLNDNNGSGADSLGVPPGTLTSFGGGSLSGSVTSNLAGASVGLAGGTLTVNADGTLSLSGTNQTGIFTFNYRLTNAGGTDDATVTIEIREAPTANDDGTYLIGTGQTLTVLTTDGNDLLDNDDRGYPLANIASFGIADAGALTTPNSVSLAGGTLQVNTDGSFSLTTPTIPGNYTFLYRLNNVVTFDDATVNIQVQQSPVAEDDSFIMLVTGTLTGDLNDLNGGLADNLGVPAYNSLTFGGGDAGGTITSNVAPASVTLAGGTLQVNLDGTFSLTTPTQTGIFTFQYRLSNTIPASDDATVTIEIREAPTANDDGTYLIGTGQTLTILTADANDLLDNDDRGYPLATIASFGGGSLAGDASANAAGASIALAGGTLQVNTDGSFSLTTPSVAGTYTFLYRLTNAVTSDDAQVTIQVQQSPIASDDAFGMQINETLNGNLVSANNGSGVDNPGVPQYSNLTFGGGDLGGTITSNTAPATNVPLAGGMLNIALDGTFSLVNPTSTGTFTFQYRLSNTIPASDDATVTIVVSATPIANDDIDLIAIYNVANPFPAGTLFADNGFGADVMGVPAGTVTLFGLATPDTATPNSIAFAGGTLTVGTDGSFSLDNPNATGSFSFFYRLENAAGSDDAQVTVTVRQVPTAQDDIFSFPYSVDQTTPNSLLLDNGSGADQLGFPAATIVSFGGGDLGGTADSFTTPQPLADGTLTVNSDGSWSLTNGPFTPGAYTFDYKISNAAGASTASVTLNIQKLPVAVDDLTYVVASGSTLNIDVPQSVLNNDDLGLPLADVESYGGGDAGGTVTTYLANTSVNPIPTYTNGMLQINVAGTGVFTPPTLPAPFCGEFDFDYRIGNSIPATDHARIIITVTCEPDAVDDTFDVLVGSALNGDLNDVNPTMPDFLGFPQASISSFGGGSLGGSVTSYTTPQALAGGTLTVNADGTFSLTGTTMPGSYTFQYRLENTVAFDDATVTIEVRQAPVAVDDLTYIATSGITLNVPAGTGLLANDTRGFQLANVASFGGSDAGGDVTTTTAGAADTTFPGFSNGSLTVNADGSFSFNAPTTAARFCGVFDFQYRLSNVAGSDDGAVQITVNCAPIAVDDTFNGGYTSGVNGVGLTGDLNDANGGLADDFGSPTATISSIDIGALDTPIAFAGGTITVSADGTFTLADADTPGTHTFNYTLTNSGGSDSALVTFVIDDAPTVTLPTSPANGAINVQPSSNIVINFSENVNIATGGVTLQCPVPTNIAFAPALPLLNTNTITVNPTADLPGNTLCTVTVVAADVSDTDANDAPNLLDGNDDNIEGDNYVFTFTTAPVANDDSYAITPHLTYDSAIAAFSVRNNDDPADSTAITGFGATLGTANGTVPNGVNSITAGGAGGRVILRANGTFLFYPDAGDSNTSATFFYTVTGGDTAQVTLNIENQELVWFVDDTAGANCTGSNVGTQACPSPTLAGIAGADTTNDTVFIAQGSYSCGMTLENGQKVIGDGATGTTLAAFSGVSPVSGSASLPTFTGTDPTLTTAAGSCFILAQNNSVRGLTIGDTSGYGFAATANIGTATITDVSDNGTGGFFRITGSGTFNAAYNVLTSTAHSDSVVYWASGGGIVTNTSGSITHAAPTLATVDISGGNLNWTYTGPITKTAGGRLIEIEDTFGALTFAGNVTQNVGAGTGVYIGGQSGGTITFGTINLGETNRLTGTGVTITGGNPSAVINLGLLNVRTTGATAVSVVNHNGTVTSTAGAVDAVSGAAINIDGPGALTTLDMTLTRVASMNSPTNGIFIQDTDGSFAVVGAGTLNSGGIIQNTSGADLAVAGNGVYLNNADNVSLAWMRINDHANNGIFGTGVRGLTLDRMLFNGNNGASNFGPHNESSVHLRDLGGDVSITNANIMGGAYNQVFIDNSSGTSPVLDLTFTGNDLGVMQGSTADVRGSALRLNIADGSADMRIEDNDFTFWWGNAVQIQVQPGASASTARIRNNRVLQTSGALAGAGGIWVLGGNLTFDISNNVVAFTNGTAISVDKGVGNTYLNGRVHNNQIGYAAASAGPGGTPPQGGSWPSTINSGSAAGMGIFVAHMGPNTTTVRVSNNTIRQINSSQAIWALVGDDVAGGGAGTLNVTIVGNNIAEEGSASVSQRHGIIIQSGRVSGDTDTMCADVGGAGALANTIVNFNTRIRPNHRFNTTMRLPGYTGGPTDTAAVNAYMAARNPGTVAVTAATAGSGGIFNTIPAGSACPQPTILD